MRDTELQYRQKGLGDEAWQFLQPCSASSYVWENLEGEQLLEVLIAKSGISAMETYDINKPGKHYIRERSHSLGYYCEVLEVGSVKVVKVCEFIKNQQSSRGDEAVDSNESSPSSQMEVQLELGQLGVSLIDQKLREFVYLCMEKVSFTYVTGYTAKSHRYLLVNVIFHAEMLF